MFRSMLLTVAVLSTTACEGPAPGVTWYEARCMDQYGLPRGTPEFAACIERDRRWTEQTQRDVESLRP